MDEQKEVAESKRGLEDRPATISETVESITIQFGNSSVKITCDAITITARPKKCRPD